MQSPISPLGELGGIVRDLFSVGGFIGSLVLLYKAILERKKPKADIDHTDAGTQKIKASADAIGTTTLGKVIDRLERNLERQDKELAELREWKRINEPLVARQKMLDKLSGAETDEQGKVK